jgi:hypothetical protein
MYTSMDKRCRWSMERTPCVFVSSAQASVSVSIAGTVRASKHRSHAVAKVTGDDSVAAPASSLCRLVGLRAGSNEAMLSFIHACDAYA